MPSMESNVGWPGWKTVRLIGQGSFGAVYEIERNLFGDVERCALKHISIPRTEDEVRELKSEGLDRESITRSFEDRARDLVDEYKLTARLNDSPYVVRCYDVSAVQKDDGIGWDVYIRMELLTPLMDRLSDELHWTEAQILRLGRDIAKALAACGKERILHRDVKPQNIFVTRDGRYKLGDFGIARIVEKFGGASTRTGTFSYMAPEVYYGKPYGAAADIYSLGMVLYWLLNERRPPFCPMPPQLPKSSDLEEARARRFSGEAIPAPLHGSHAMKQIVLKACAFDPKDRYQTADEMLSDLSRLALANDRQVGEGCSAYTSDSGSEKPDAAEAAPSPMESRDSIETEDGGTIGIFGIHEDKDAVRENDADIADSQAGADGTIGIFGTHEDKDAASDDDADLVVSEAGADGTENRLDHHMIVEDAPKADAAANETASEAGTEEAADEAGPKETNEPASQELSVKRQTGKSKKRLWFGIGTAAVAACVALILLLPGKTATPAPMPQTTETSPAITAVPSATATPEPKETQVPQVAASSETEQLDQTDTRKAVIESTDRLYSGDIRFVAAGDNYTVVLKSDGTLAVAGKISLNDDAKRYKDDVESWKDIIAVAAGGEHIVGLRSDGTVSVAGRNDYGQCDAKYWSDIVAVAAGQRHTVGLKRDGTVVAVGSDRDGQCYVKSWNNIVAIAASGNYTIGLKNGGTVESVGSGVGYLKDLTNIVAVEAGSGWRVVLKEDGALVFSSSSDRISRSVVYADLSAWKDIVQISGGWDYLIGLKSDGTVLAAGRNGSGQCNVENWSDIVAIAAGINHTVGLTRDGRLVAVGDNKYGQCNVEALYQSASAEDASEAINARVLQSVDGVMQFNLVYRDEFNNEEAWKTGTCFLINSNTIVTAAHCCRLTDEDLLAMAEYYGKSVQEVYSRLRYSVTINRDVSLGATMKQQSLQMDFAVLQLETSLQDKKPLVMRHSSEVEQTERVYAVGFPGQTTREQSTNRFNSEDATITVGNVDQVVNIHTWANADFIRSSCRLTNGMSGGPMVDGGGYVIGICHGKSGEAEDDSYYAVCIDQLLAVCDAVGISYVLASS